MSGIRLTGRFWKWIDYAKNKGEHGNLETHIFNVSTILRVSPSKKGAWVYIRDCSPFWVSLPESPIERGDEEQAANYRALKKWEHNL